MPFITGSNNALQLVIISVIKATESSLTAFKCTSDDSKIVFDVSKYIYLKTI